MRDRKKYLLILLSQTRLNLKLLGSFHLFLHLEATEGNF